MFTPAFARCSLSTPLSNVRRMACHSVALVGGGRENRLCVPARTRSAVNYSTGPIARYFGCHSTRAAGAGAGPTSHSANHNVGSACGATALSHTRGQAI